MKVAELPVKHHPRQFGRSKYGIGRTMRVVLDLMTVRFLLSYSNPLAPTRRTNVSKHSLLCWIA